MLNALNFYVCTAFIHWNLWSPSPKLVNTAEILTEILITLVLGFLHSNPSQK